ncbi:MAG: hypothetical protein ACQESF_07370, partial [Nanobdellota archaeon]
TIKKLEEVFAIGGSDREACFYANISMQTLYNHQKENPKFLERKTALKEKPVLRARQEVVKGLSNNPEFSLKYLERKRKREFSPRSEITGKDGEPVLNDIRVIFEDFGKDENNTK